MSQLVRLRPAVAALVVAAAGGLVTVLGLLASGGPAQAAACSGTSGVSVVVEFNQLSGGVHQVCVADGGGHTADRVLKDAGFSLDYVQRFPGFVCRIDGLPADDPCVNTPPADAYWGLWWSDGKSGTWTYSSLSAGSLTLPAGSYVAMVWDGSSGTVRPTVGAPAHATPTPTPTSAPTPNPSRSPTPTATPTPSASPSLAPTTSPAKPPVSPTPTRSPNPRPTKTHGPSQTPTTTSAEPTPSDTETEAAGATSTPPGDPGSSGGLPGWVPPVLVAALLVAAAAVAVVRRRSS